MNDDREVNERIDALLVQRDQARAQIIDARRERDEAIKARDALEAEVHEARAFAARVGWERDDAQKERDQLRAFAERAEAIAQADALFQGGARGPAEYHVVGLLRDFDRVVDEADAARERVSTFTEALRGLVDAFDAVGVRQGASAGPVTGLWIGPHSALAPRNEWKAFTNALNEARALAVDGTDTPTSRFPEDGDT
jgi:hypothetical protein